MSALLHDIGHGPFSHAIEPVIGFSSIGPDNPTQNWITDISRVQQALRKTYYLDKMPTVSETLAVMMVASPTMKAVIGHGNFLLPKRGAIIELQDSIIAAIVGAVAGPGADHLSKIVSSQIDGDKLDYMVRDAHHAGVGIGFDTLRLLAKMEILAVTPDRLDEAAEDLRKRARESSDQLYFDLGIAASGFGSFEQMLIGRTFLYDRLYHHHKVRAADAMAQRLVITAQNERTKQLQLDEIFVRVSDDTMIRILGGDVTHPKLIGGHERARKLAQAILDRELYHRAFAFRGRFVACPPNMDEKTKEQLRRGKWSGLVKHLATLENRVKLERKIFSLAEKIGTELNKMCPSDKRIQDALDFLQKGGAEQVIVDLPENKADAIRILARYPNQRLAVPEFSFNPVKWADAYDLQKRTGYVFCPREIVPIVGLAAKLTFMSEFGVVMGKEADGYIKAEEIPPSWINILGSAGIIDDEALRYIAQKKFSLLKIEAKNIDTPESWVSEYPDFSVEISAKLNEILPSGLVDDELRALSSALKGLFVFLESWHSSDGPTKDLKTEAALQSEVCNALRFQKIKVTEGGSLSGGKYDLVVEGRIVVENKIVEESENPFGEKPTAGSQGRRYAVALGSRVIIVVVAYIPKPGNLLSQTQSVCVRRIGPNDEHRAEVRIVVPYGAVVPSREKVG